MKDGWWNALLTLRDLAQAMAFPSWMFFPQICLAVTVNLLLWIDVAVECAWLFSFKNMDGHVTLPKGEWLRDKIFILKIYVTNFPIYKLSISLNSSYILHKKWMKFFRDQIDLFNFKTYKMTIFYLLWFVFIRCTTCCHLLPSLVVICYHSLSLAVICCHSLWFVVIRCHSLYHTSHCQLL